MNHPAGDEPNPTPDASAAPDAPERDDRASGASHAAPPSPPPLPPRPPLPVMSSHGEALHPTLPLPDAPPLVTARADSDEVADAQTPRRRGVGAGAVVSLVLAAALVGGAAGFGGAYATGVLSNPQTAPAITQPSEGGAVVINDTEDVNLTTAIASKALPSVVTIDVSSAGSGGSGSGVVLTEDGYVVTNTHVLTMDGAESTPTIRVTDSGGRIYQAQIVGLDPIYDLAVIKLEGAEGLTPIEFADSSNLNVGDVAVALGAPLGLPNTVTTGIVSALNRSIEIASSAVPETDEDVDGDSEGEDGFGEGPFQFDIPGGQSGAATETIKIAVIQTDAAINPGNSGGALVDADGRLVGINVAIATANRTSNQAGSIGVGFSIPSNVVERVTSELIETGEATHGLLGATVSSAATKDGATRAGAFVEEVSDGGAAAGGGLRQGDVIVGFNGTTIGDQVDLTAQVRAAAAGSEATVTYERDGELVTADVVLGSLPSS